MFRNGDLGTNADVIYHKSFIINHYISRCNGGVAVPFFENALYRLQIFKMVLRPGPAYGCIMAC